MSNLQETSQGIPIGKIGNYYGGIWVMEHEGKYYWLIQNYDTDFTDLQQWDEIDKELYNSLIAYENRRAKL